MNKLLILIASSLFLFGFELDFATFSGLDQAA